MYINKWSLLFWICWIIFVVAWVTQSYVVTGVVGMIMGIWYFNKKTYTKEETEKEEGN